MGQQTKQQADRQTVWRWVFRDPVSGRILTDGRMTEREAARYPGAMRIAGVGRDPRCADERVDFEDTQAGSFQATGSHLD